jgi:hypothetical protein
METRLIPKQGGYSFMCSDIDDDGIQIKPN